MTIHSRPSEVSDSERDSDACQLLWFAVLVQIITDSQSEAICPRAQADREQARRWLTDLENNIDFRIICELAGLDLDDTLVEVEKILRHHKSKPDFRTLRKFFIRRKSKRSAREYQASTSNRKTASELAAASPFLARAS